MIHRTFTEPAAAIALGDVPDIPDEILNRYRVGVDRVYRYVLFHAAHWNAAYNQSRVGKRAVRSSLNWDGRTVDNCHAAAVDAGLIAEIGKSQPGKVQPLTYPWFQPPEELTEDPRHLGTNQPPEEPTEEPPEEPTEKPPEDPRSEGKRREDKGDARAKRTLELTAASLDANNPLEDSDDPGCDAHKWNGSEKPCGGCRDARNRQQQRDQLAKQRRQQAAAQAESEMWRREFKRAEENRASNIEPGHVDRLAAELAAANTPEPDNQDPQAIPECTHTPSGRPNARGPKRCATCKATLTPEQLDQAQAEHHARRKASA